MTHHREHASGRSPEAWRWLTCGAAWAMADRRAYDRSAVIFAAARRGRLAAASWSGYSRRYFLDLSASSLPENKVLDARVDGSSVCFAVANRR